MNIFNKIKLVLIKWLLPDMLNNVNSLVTFNNEEQMKLFREFLDKFGLSHNCYVCNKQVISSWDNKYSDYLGRVFCSHKCIDNLKDIKGNKK